jgi:nitrile hydratase accessory protein
MTVQAEVTAMAGAEALPRSNGELVFEEPWQARAFGVAVGLVQEQGLDWEDFRRRLIEEIAAPDDAHADASAAAYGYYERWLAALERLVLETGMVSEAELEAEARHIAAEDAHEHDHDGHDH